MRTRTRTRLNNSNIELPCMYLGGEDEEASPHQVLENQPKEGGTEVGETHQQGTVCRLK